LLWLGWAIGVAVALSSCAGKPRLVAPPSAMVPARLGPIETVVVLEPSLRIVDLRGRDTRAAYQAATVACDLLVATAVETLGKRRPPVRAIAPGSPDWPEEQDPLLRAWSQRSLEVTRGKLPSQEEICALGGHLGMESNAGVLFLSLEARLGDDGQADIPLFFTGEAETHMAVLRAALCSFASTSPAWTNTILLRASPTHDNPHLRQAVQRLFAPLVP
jgi:hypothetical protein